MRNTTGYFTQRSESLSQLKTVHMLRDLLRLFINAAGQVLVEPFEFGSRGFQSIGDPMHSRCQILKLITCLNIERRS